MRLADVLHFLDRLQLRNAGRGVGVLAGQRDVELPAADEVAVADRAGTRGVAAAHGDDAVRHDERGDGDAELLRRHVEQHATGLRGDPAHGIAVGLQGVGSTRSTLIDRVVRAAHHATGLVVGNVELVRHDLPERRAGALAQVGLADKEGGGVVGADDDPGVELQEVGVGIGARGDLRDELTPHKGGPYGEPYDQHARRLDEVASGTHAITFAARLMAALIR